MMEASSHRVMIDKTFSVPKCVRPARTSHHSHQLLKKMRGAVPGPRVVGFSYTWGEELLSLEKEKSSDFEKQSTSGKVLNNDAALEENDWIHSKMMELESLLEASGERNL